eukprot:Nk52_evm9s89 gene=Nk52_evmTU9s89
MFLRNTGMKRGAQRERMLWVILTICWGMVMLMGGAVVAEGESMRPGRAAETATLGEVDRFTVSDKLPVCTVWNKGVVNCGEPCVAQCVNVYANNRCDRKCSNVNCGYDSGSCYLAPIQPPVLKYVKEVEEVEGNDTPPKRQLRADVYPVSENPYEDESMSVVVRINMPFELFNSSYRESYVIYLSASLSGVLYVNYTGPMVYPNFTSMTYEADPNVTEFNFRYRPSSTSNIFSQFQIGENTTNERGTLYDLNTYLGNFTADIQLLQSHAIMKSYVPNIPGNTVIPVGPVNPKDPCNINPDGPNCKSGGDGFFWVYIGVGVGVGCIALIAGTVFYQKRKRSCAGDEEEGSGPDDEKRQKMEPLGDSEDSEVLLSLLRVSDSDGLEKFLNGKKLSDSDGLNRLLKDPLPGTNTHAIALCAAISSVGCCERLVKFGADVNTETSAGETPIFGAVRNENVEMVRFLINSGASVNVVNKFNSSPAHEAASLSNSDIVKLLRNAKGNMNAKDTFGCTPLLIGVKYNCIEVVRYLVGLKELDIDDGDNKGWTATHWAASVGDNVVLDMVVNAGARLNICNKIGETPLLLACREGHVCTVQFLLSKKVNRNLQDQYMRVAEDAAAFRGHDHIVRMLRDYSHVQSPALVASTQTVKELLLDESVDISPSSSTALTQQDSPDNTRQSSLEVLSPESNLSSDYVPTHPRISDTSEESLNSQYYGVPRHSSQSVPLDKVSSCSYSPPQNIYTSPLSGNDSPVRVTSPIYDATSPIYDVNSASNPYCSADYSQQFSLANATSKGYNPVVTTGALPHVSYVSPNTTGSFVHPGLIFPGTNTRTGY